MIKMTLRTIALLACVLSLAPVAMAHDGPHKVMGTVALVRERGIDVKATDGKTVAIVTDSKTRVIQDKVAIKISDIKSGDRVVVTATEKKGTDGKTIWTASEIRLGAPAVKSKGRR